ncbi:HPr family phosphocarrier protein [Spelaeicoccus albus]|uniref:Phosphocarrier protein HPr n=1 Tax=Spelaeicoccus albus TaxID=1280376 RepID=A0A7Z0D2E3_9MICO|nr:HPr family phosphocarrier protein [Spelaeicoccus albus]NYI67619.1 phosphocarrier protein [Spelaeicoccus albus]
MPERTATVASTVGLHARPAAALVEAAAQQPVTVMIARDGVGPDGGRGEAVDASSILSLMTLGAEYGSVVVLTAEGDGAEAALDVLAAVIETNLDED